MNRGELRASAAQRISYRSDIDADMTADLNNRINEAQKKLASDVPGALLPDTENVVLLKEYTHTTMDRTLDASSDLWVLKLGVADPTNPTYPQPVTDGTWDWIYHLEITDPDGVLHRRVVREIWEGEPIAQGEYGMLYLSLDRPWRNTTDTEMTFRLYVPEFFCKDDVMSVVSGGVWDRAHAKLHVLPASFLDFYYGSDEVQGRAKGPPAYLRRGRHVQVEAPTKAPVATVADGNTWAGPHPWVQARFVYTYVKGKRDAEFLSPGGSYDPMLESSPSPVSNSVSITSNSAKIVLSGLPNIDFMQNFGITGTLRKGHSGIRKRIYVYIDAINSGAGFSTDSIEAQGVAVYLGEVDGLATTFAWDGSVIPEYDRRIPESHGYFAHSMTPANDQRYEVDFQVRRRPRDLLTDNDATRLLPSADEALITLVMAAFQEMLGKNAEAAILRDTYTKIEVPKLQATVGNPEHVIPGATWGEPSQRTRAGAWWGRSQPPFTS